MGAVFSLAFYDSFPGFGRSWVSVNDLFNEHLVRAACTEGSDDFVRTEACSCAERHHRNLPPSKIRLQPRADAGVARVSPFTRRGNGKAEL